MSSKEWFEFKNKHAIFAYSDLDQESDIASSENNKELAPVTEPDGNRLKLSALMPMDELYDGSHLGKDNFDNKDELRID